MMCYEDMQLMMYNSNTTTMAKGICFQVFMIHVWINYMTLGKETGKGGSISRQDVSLQTYSTGT